MRNEPFLNRARRALRRAAHDAGSWATARPRSQYGVGAYSAARKSINRRTLCGKWRRLVRMDLYNGGASAATITISCTGQSTLTFSLAAAELRTQDTGWSGTCTAVTIASTNGWLTNFDNLVVSS